MTSNRLASRELGLELVRGIAAFGVFFSHAVRPIGFFALESVTSYFVSLGLAWVMMFFLLSGAVNSLSLQRRDLSFREFLGRRTRRLYPIYFAACLIAMLVDHWLGLYRASLWSSVCVMFFCTGHVFPGLPKGVVCDSAIWSLTFEFAFYFMFVLTMHRGRGIQFVWAGLATVALIAASLFSFPLLIPSLLFILASSGLWLLGFWLPSISRKSSVSLIFAAAASAVGLMLISNGFPKSFLREFRYIWFGLWQVPLFLAVLGSLKPGLLPSWRELICLTLGYTFAAFLFIFSNAPYSVLCLALLMPLAAVLLAPAIRWLYSKAIQSEGVCRAILNGGRYSYALYLIHMPVCFLGVACAQPFWPRLIFIVLLTALLTWLLEAHVHSALLRIWDRILLQISSVLRKKHLPLPVISRKRSSD